MHDALAQRLAEQLCVHARGTQFLYLHVADNRVAFYRSERERAVAWAKSALLAGHIVHRRCTRNDPGEVIARLAPSWAVPR